MIRAILDFCIRQRLIVLLATAAIIAFGWYSTKEVPVDAIPDVGENQVIVYTPWPGRSPKDIENQITYPLSVKLRAVPGAESVRGKSMFGFSFVQVTFADNTDFYWARSRVSEQLASVTAELPEGVSPQLGPDATALGQIYYYVLDAPREMNLADQRSMQDFVIKYELHSVDGVSEVASIGGYRRQYQIEVDPDKLRYHSLSLNQVITAVKSSNIDVGAKTIETGGMEYIIRGVGFIGASQDTATTIKEIENTVVITREGVPLRVRDLGHVQSGPDFRRGALDLNGREAVGGVVVMRYGENPRRVIENVRQRIEQLEPSLGVPPVPAEQFFEAEELATFQANAPLVIEKLAAPKDGSKEPAAKDFDEIIGRFTDHLPELPADYRYAYDVETDSLEIKPPNVKIIGVYDRTQLVDETVDTLSTALFQQILITAIVIVLFLLHVRASIVVAVTLPTAVLMSFIAMNVFGVDANIMSLAGIAIAIGTIVDMGIIVSENIYRHLAQWEQKGKPGGQERRLIVIREAAAEVVPAVITAVSTTVVSFLPVFFLTGRDFRLFAPLAWTKTFALVASLLVAVLLVPLLSRLLLSTTRWPYAIRAFSGVCFGMLLGATCYTVWGPTLVEWTSVALPVVTALAAVAGFALGYLLTCERLRPIEHNPVSWLITRTYEPTLRLLLRYKKTFLAVPTVLVILGLGAWLGLPVVMRPFEKAAGWLGAEMNDVPGYVDAKHKLTGLKEDDWIALDEGSWFYMPSLYPAASFSQAMQVLQTQDAMIKEIPEVETVLGKIGRVDSALDPAPAAMIETYVMLKPKKDWRPEMTEKKIWDEINDTASQVPGLTRAAPLQPIEGRVVMLQSGIKASMAIRVSGDSLDGLAESAREIAKHLKTVPQVQPDTVNPDIVLGKPYVEFDIDREDAARYGMTTMMVNEVVEAALGGTNVTMTYEGRERYPIQVRYQRDLVERIDQLDKLPVVTHAGEVVPLGRLAEMQESWGPGVISSENARLVAHVSFAPKDSFGDMETVKAALASVNDARDDMQIPDGYTIEAVGSFENQIEANQRLMWLIPLVIGINLFIIYLQFRHVPITLAVFSGIPVAFAGGMILLGVLQIEMNTAVWIGFIALFGIAIDDGVVIATYLQQVFQRRRLGTVADVRNATVEAGLKRIRPCLMTTFTTLAALVPVLMATGRGADVARAMALPVFGGMLVEFITLFVVPVVFCAYKEFELATGLVHTEAEDESELNDAAGADAEEEVTALV